MALAYTEALPRFDRVTVYPLHIKKPILGPDEEAIPEDKRFPIHTYGKPARILASVELDGESSQRIGAAWRSLSFDEFAGAFCHIPAYGLRFYRGDKLLFETSICWDCTNFYMPEVSTGDRTKRRTYRFYGFARDERAAHLLKLLKQLAPHPELSAE